ncbi:MAG TPA: hypothetical protein VGE52_21175 [Pirellulales bacterium]
MGRLTTAREALAKAAEEVGKLHDEQETLLKSLAPYENKELTGQIAAVAQQLMKKLVAVSKKLKTAQTTHDRAIKDLDDLWKEKFGSI